MNCSRFLICVRVSDCAGAGVEEEEVGEEEEGAGGEEEEEGGGAGGGGILQKNARKLFLLSNSLCLPPAQDVSKDSLIHYGVSGRVLCNI